MSSAVAGASRNYHRREWSREGLVEACAGVGALARRREVGPQVSAEILPYALIRAIWFGVGFLFGWVLRGKK